MTELVPDTAPEETPEAALQVARMKTENARLRGELRQGLARAERAERSLERVQNSAKYQIGDLFVQAAKHPRKLFLLPRDLWRIYSLRRAKRRQPKPTGPLPLQRARRDELLDLEAARLLLPRTMARPGAPLAIAGALSRATAEAWSAYAAVTPVLPHEAADLVLDIDADIVVIETAAALPGESWAYLGDPSVSDRELQALRMIDSARERGRPVVFLRNTPPAHTVFLRSLAERCDRIVDGPGSARGEHVWHPGIDPAAWVPGRGDHSADALAVLGGSGLADGSLVSRGTPTEQALALALSAAMSGMDVRVPDPARPTTPATLAALAASRVAVAFPLVVPDREVGAAPLKLGALAAGLPLITGPDSDLASLGLGDFFLASASDAAQVLAAAREAGGQDRTLARLQSLRAIVPAYGVPVMLQALVDELHLPARPRAAWDVSLVIDGDPDVAAILAQSWAPAEIISPRPLSDAARDALVGVRIVTLPGADLRDPQAQRMAASSPFVASEVDLAHPDALLDLLIGALTGTSLPPVTEGVSA